MPTTITTANVFPSHNDVAETEHLGDRGTEATLSTWLDMLPESNFFVSGFTMTNPSGLTVAVASGYVYINGYRIYVSGSTNLTMTDATTNYIHVNYHLDGSSRVDRVEYTVNTDGAAVTNGIRLGEVLCAAGAVSSMSDRRVFYPFTQQRVKPYKAFTHLASPLNITGLVATWSNVLTLTVDSAELTGDEYVMVAAYGRYTNATQDPQDFQLEGAGITDEGGCHFYNQDAATGDGNFSMSAMGDLTRGASRTIRLRTYMTLFADNIDVQQAYLSLLVI